MQNEKNHQKGSSTSIEDVDENSTSDSDDDSEEKEGPPRGSFWDSTSDAFNTPNRESIYHVKQRETQRKGAPPLSSDTRQHSFVFMGGESSDKQQRPGFSPADPNGPSSPGAPPPVVSTENERQILLLMLLAQVCALHDPTPRTFTVHVLELFERGILDRESIRFLFDYGLVPSLPAPTAITASAATTSPTKSTKAKPTPTTPTSAETVQDTEGAVVPYAPADQEEFNRALRRSQEASAIRSHLAHHHSDPSLTTTEQNVLSPTSVARTSQGSASPRSSSWAAKHFPLSLSRYQREFREDRLVASGSFGQVFCATKLMDGRKYAVKKVIFSATGYSSDSVTKVLREVLCLAQCDHVHCVRYYNSWLEPSWMTGQNTSSAATIRQQEQQLLMDMERVSANNNPQGKSTQRPKRPSRRFSFDNNGCGSDDDIFSYYNDPEGSDSDYSEWTCDMSRGTHHRGNYGPNDFSEWGYSLDDSVVGRRSQNKNAGQNAKRKSQTQQQQSAYKYEICMYIQMELCGSTTLADWIQHRNLTKPSVEERVSKALVIFRQICCGLAHVHSKSILHRDLKPANVLKSLDDDDEIFKICDFGLAKSLCTATQGEQRVVWTDTGDDTKGSPSKRLTSPTKSLAMVAQGPAQFPSPPLFGANQDDPHLLTAGIGTASYAAPEQIQSRRYGPEADIFSMGLILLELFCCFDTQHERLDTFQDCRRGKVPSWITEDYPVVASTILACCNSSPKSRPTAQALLDSDLWSLLDERSDDRKISKEGDKSEKHVKEADEKQHTDDTVQCLQDQLKEQQMELENQRLTIAEKDRMIHQLRREMEELKVGAGKRNGVGDRSHVVVDPSAAREMDTPQIRDATESHSSDEDDY